MSRSIQQLENSESWPPEEALSALAVEVDRQLILDLGGEFISDSGFEHEIAEDVAQGARTND